MKRVLFILVVLPSLLSAQPDYAPSPKPPRPSVAPLSSARWSIGADLLGPASALWIADSQQEVVRLGFAMHRWVRDNNGLRAGYSFTRFTWEIPYAPALIDSVQERGTDSYRDQVHALRLGVVSMKRDRRFSPVVGLSLVLSADEVYRSRSAEAQRLDSVVNGIAFFSDLPSYEAPSEGYRQDWWGEVGVEGALGLSYRLTRHLEIEGRLGLWVRWRAMLTNAGEDPEPDPGPAGEAIRSGVVYPAIFLHYAW